MGANDNTPQKPGVLTFEQLCDQVLIDGLPKALKEVLARVIRKGWPKTAVMCAVRSQAQPHTLTYFGCEAFIDQQISLRDGQIETN